MDFTVILVAGVTLSLVCRMLAMFIEMKKRIARLSHLDVKLDLLLSHAGIKFDPLAAMPREAADALKRGDKIEAIRLYRASTGAGLAEAKEIIEAAQS